MMVEELGLYYFYLVYLEINNLKCHLRVLYAYIGYSSLNGSEQLTSQNTKEREPLILCLRVFNRRKIFFFAVVE